MPPSTKLASRTYFLNYGISYDRSLAWPKADPCYICCNTLIKPDESARELGYKDTEIPVKIIACGHIFGVLCLYQWLGFPLHGGRAEPHNTCPICRKVLFSDLVDFSTRNGLPNDESDVLYRDATFSGRNALYLLDYKYRKWAEPDIITKSDAGLPQTMVRCRRWLIVGKDKKPQLLQRRFPSDVVRRMYKWIDGPGRIYNVSTFYEKKELRNQWPWPVGTRVIFDRENLTERFRYAGEWHRAYVSSEEMEVFKHVRRTIRVGIESMDAEVGMTKEVYELQTELMSFVVRGLSTYATASGDSTIYTGMGNLLLYMVSDMLCFLDALNRPAPIEQWMNGSTEGEDE